MTTKGHSVVSLEEPELDLSPDQLAIREQVAQQLATLQKPVIKTKPVTYTLDSPSNHLTQQQRILVAAPTKPDQAISKRKLTVNAHVKIQDGLRIIDELTENGLLERIGTPQHYRWYKIPVIDQIGIQSQVSTSGLDYYEIELTITEKRSIKAESVDDALAKIRRLPGLIDVLGVHKVVG